MSVISYRLDLVINLVDTTTGKVVEERNVLFYKDGIQLRPEHREEGSYLLLNTGRDDFELVVEISGYETYHGFVRYSALDERMPVYAVYLIPKDTLKRGEPVISYTDRIPGLEAMEAITLLRANCAANEYQAKKKGIDCLSD